MSLKHQGEVTGYLNIVEKRQQKHEHGLDRAYVHRSVCSILDIAFGGEHCQIPMVIANLSENVTPRSFFVLEHRREYGVDITENEILLSLQIGSECCTSSPHLIRRTSTSRPGSIGRFDFIQSESQQTAKRNKPTDKRQFRILCASS